MKKLIPFLSIAICLSALTAFTPGNKKPEWKSLFDGKTLNNWKVGKNAATFTIEEGMIVANGPVAHLFYDGDINNHQFKNFEFKADVMTTPGSNSGIYFHTEYQQGGWPAKGYEVQVNNSHTDWRRTGSLYGIEDVKEVYVKDNEWYTEYIKVEGKRVVIKINDKTVVDYTEPDNINRNGGDSLRKISTGTFALQGHDPKSKVYYKNILVNLLPE
ncbi:MAG: 3-keto-disaccharide hydrolase [Chitinophagaceae bacterium]